MNDRSLWFDILAINFLTWALVIGVVMRCLTTA